MTPRFFFDACGDSRLGHPELLVLTRALIPRRPDEQPSGLGFSPHRRRKAVQNLTDTGYWGKLTHWLLTGEEIA